MGAGHLGAGHLGADNWAPRTFGRWRTFGRRHLGAEGQLGAVDIWALKDSWAPKSGQLGAEKRTIGRRSEILKNIKNYNRKLFLNYCSLGYYYC